MLLRFPRWPCLIGVGDASYILKAFHFVFPGFGNGGGGGTLDSSQSAQLPLGPNDFFQTSDDFGGREAGGGDFDGVVGFHQHRHGAGSVAFIAVVLSRKDFVEVDLLAAGGEVLEAARARSSRRP